MASGANHLKIVLRNAFSFVLITDSPDAASQGHCPKRACHLTGRAGRHKRAGSLFADQGRDSCFINVTQFCFGASASISNTVDLWLSAS